MKNSGGYDFLEEDGDELGGRRRKSWGGDSKKFWVLMVVVGAVVLWVFTVYLPQVVLPEAVKLEGIVKVAELGVTLRPLDHHEVAPWIDKADFDGEGEISDGEEGDGEEGEEIEGGEVKTGGEDEVHGEKHHDEANRLILIGDIHGMYTSMRKLIRKVKYNPKKDKLLFLGDFTTKGPDSLKVLEFAMKNDVSCIIGNHEYYVLQHYAKYHGLPSPTFISEEIGNDDDKGLSWRAPSVLEDPDFQLAKRLQPHHIKYINSCPVIMKLGKVPLHKKGETKSYTAIDGVAIHGGLRWDLIDHLEAQDPVEGIEMRSLIGPYYNRSTDDPSTPNAVSWSKIYNMKMKQFRKDHKHTLSVYYGHDARRGLKLKRYTKGLDSGCVKGKRLTAMVIWNEKVSHNGKSSIVYREKPFLVSC